jgi:adenine nucleotide transporter 17
MMRLIYNEEGMKGFFKGILPSLVLTVNPIISFVVYESMRVRLVDSNGYVSGYNVIIMSLISKLIATMLTYPILTIKTLFQANEKLSSKELIAIIQALLANEGIGGLYKGKYICLFLGIGAKTIQTLINNTVAMLTYEKIQFLVKLIVFGIVLKLRKSSI